MTVTLTTFESNLQTKLNNTTGTTDGQEFLLLSKSVEALNPSITVAAVQAEGATQVAAVQGAASGFAPLAGATFTGAIDMGSNNITTTGKVLYANMYATPGDLPSASTYHGLFAHTHSNGRAVFSHNSNWYNLLHEDTSGNVNLGGDLTVTGSLIINGTTTTINSTTLDVDDLNITVAKGAADAAAANGAGISVDGASATFSYASSGDKWTMNKPLDVAGSIDLSGQLNAHTEISKFSTIREEAHIDTGTGGTTSLHMKDGKAVIYFTNNQAQNAQVNFKGDSSTTLDSLLAVGDSVTAALIYTQGGTAYYLNQIQVDGTTANVTTKWVGGTPTGGNTNSLDAYTITIIKTASGTFTALANLTAYE